MFHTPLPNFVGVTYPFCCMMENCFIDLKSLNKQHKHGILLYQIVSSHPCPRHCEIEGSISFVNKSDLI